MSKRLLIADDHELMLAGITQMLSPELEIVGVARNGRVLVSEALRLAPDLIVLDIGMPELNGIEATRQIMAALPATKVIVLTQQLSPTHVLAAFRAGARGYVAKQSAATELMEAVRAILSEQYYLTVLALPKELKRSAGGAMSRNPVTFFSDPLTPRQREVLVLIAHGKQAKEIAGALNISVKTVDFHKGTLMDELGLRTTAELTSYAIANGLVLDTLS